MQVSVATKFTTVKTLRQQYVFCPQKYKETFLVYALNELSGSTSIVFVRTCDSCRKLTLMLRNLGFGAVSIHGQMSQPKRLAALHKFKAGVCMHLLSLLLLFLSRYLALFPASSCSEEGAASVNMCLIQWFLIDREIPNIQDYFLSLS